jgi:hypothetical protein
MNCADLEKEIDRGKGIFTEIVRVTSDFLGGFTKLEATEIKEFEQRRQALLETLLEFRSGLGKKLSVGENTLPLEMARQLDEFRIFQEVFVQIIMEKNAAIVSRANQSLERMRAELEMVGRGKQAMRGYNRNRSNSWKCLEKTV